MLVEDTELPEVKLITPDAHPDYRGYFFESFRSRKLGVSFVQGNVSSNRPWVIRGLHYQLNNPQGKLVQVIQGSIFDVAVDIRRGSPNFGKWVGRLLSETNHAALYVPPDFAHGFLSLSAGALVHYSCTTEYDEPSNRSIKWNDSMLGIEWPIGTGVHTLGKPVISVKDQNAAPFADAELPEFKQLCSKCGVDVEYAPGCVMPECPREFL